MVSKVEKNIISTISYDQHEILRGIIALHSPVGFELDPTFGGGAFYKNGVPAPRLKFDLHPRKAGVLAADCRALPLRSQSVSSAIFDPPFMARTGPGATLKGRFGELVGSINDLWRFYGEALAELHRVIAIDGALTFKCQDGVLSGKNNFTHCEIYKMAWGVGFMPIDLFVLLARHRMMHPWHRRQIHARKFHSYFWVLRRVG